MWKLDFINSISHSCMEAITVPILKSMNSPYHLFNTIYFYTHYFDDYSKRLRRNKFEDFVEKLFGLKMNIIDFKNNCDSFLDIIFSEINKFPVGVMVDPYYCYWTNFYQKDHWSHALLIVDVNNKKIFTCFDVHYPSKGYIYLSAKQLETMADKFIFFIYKERNHNFISVAVEQIQDQINQYNKKDLIDERDSLIKYLTLESKSLEITTSDIEVSKDLMGLMWIAEDKKNFTVSMKYIEKQNNESIFYDVYHLFDESNQLFLMLKSLMMKYAISGVLKKEKLESIIYNIYALDEIAVCELQKAIQKLI